MVNNMTAEINRIACPGGGFPATGQMPCDGAKPSDINTIEWQNCTESIYAEIPEEEVCIDVRNVSFWYGGKQVLHNVSIPVKRNSITALIGPSGCGKSTLLRCMNRMNDLADGSRIAGSMRFHGSEIHSSGVDVNQLRSRIGMVFQKPNPFPMTIRENITYGPRIHGIRNRRELDRIVERCLRGAALYDEVSDRLDSSALGLSGGQQQRLCIARALSIDPEVILMDEPTSALDPIASSRVEELVTELKKDYTVVMVTHNMQQASRISDYTGFMYMGKMMEFNTTERMFSDPAHPMTGRYLTGRFG